MKKCTLALAISLAATCAHATEIQVVYMDNQGVGFFSNAPFKAEGGNNATTLGEARRNAVERVARMMETQIVSSVPVKWAVKFQENEGYGAVTLGPVFSRAVGMSDNQFIEEGRNYPLPLMSALLESDHSNGEAVATTMFSEYGDYYGFDNPSVKFSFLSVALHELTHVMGFAHIACLGNCYDKKHSEKTHLSKFVYYKNEAFENLVIDKQVEAASSVDKLWFVGSAKTKRNALANLTGGTHNDGAIELHANGDLDGQEIAHFSENVHPKQLMASAGGNVLTLGAAADVLCDIGWCRNTGSVVDIAIESIYSAEKTAPGKAALIGVRLSNKTDEIVNGVMAQIDIPANLSASNFSLGNYCSVQGKKISCAFESMQPGQIEDIFFDAKGDGKNTISGKAWFTSFNVDRDGTNNLLTQQVSFEDNSAPEVTITGAVSSLSGVVNNIQVNATDKDNDSLSHTWLQVSGPAVEIVNLSGMGMRFTMPDSSVSFKLSVTDSTSTVEKIHTVEIKKEAVKSEEKSGGSTSLLAILALIGLTVIRKCRK